MHDATMATATIDRTGAPVRTRTASTIWSAPRLTVRGQEDQSAVEPIRDDPGRHRQDEVGGDAGGTDEAQGERDRGIARRRR